MSGHHRQHPLVRLRAPAGDAAAALDVARRLGHGRLRLVVTVAPDSGLKYLQGDLYA